MMNFKAAYHALMGLETKEAPVVSISSLGMPRQMSSNFKAFASEGYQQNIIVYRCVRLIAEAAASVGFKLTKGDTELSQHPLLLLLDRPNLVRSRYELFTAYYSYLLLSGNSYLLRCGPDSGPPREIYSIRPDRIKVVPGQTELPSRYDYEVEGRVIDRYDIDPLTGDSVIKHSRLWNPLDDWHGMSPLKAAALSVDQHNETGKHNLSLLQNGAAPKGAWTFKPTDAQGKRAVLTAEQRQSVKEDIDRAFRGSANAGKSPLMEGDFSWTQLGLTPSDMDWANLKNMSTTDIAMAYGVPPQLVGVQGSLTFANFEQARLALYEDAVLPLIERGEADLNEWLVPQFNEDLVISYNKESIPALAERRAIVMERSIKAVTAGLLSRNEGREEIGREPVEGGDTIYIPSTMLPLDVAASDRKSVV